MIMFFSGDIGDRMWSQWKATIEVIYGAFIELVRAQSTL